MGIDALIWLIFYLLIGGLVIYGVQQGVAWLALPVVIQKIIVVLVVIVFFLVLLRHFGLF